MKSLCSSPQRNGVKFSKLKSADGIKSGNKKSPVQLTLAKIYSITGYVTLPSGENNPPRIEGSQLSRKRDGGFPKSLNLSDMDLSGILSIWMTAPV